MKQMILTLNVVEVSTGIVIFNKDLASPQDIIPACQLFGQSGRKIEVIFEERDFNQDVSAN